MGYNEIIYLVGGDWNIFGKTWLENGGLIWLDGDLMGYNGIIFWLVVTGT